MSLLKIFKIQRIGFLIESIKSNFIFLLILITWFSLLLSINTHPSEINKIFNSPISFINASRFIFAALMSLISIFLLIYLLIIRKLNNFSNISIIFILYFFFQIVGLFSNESREINLDNTYLVLFGFGTISTLIILFETKNDFYINLFFLISIIVLTLAFLIILFSLNDYFTNAIDQGSLYYLYHPHLTFMNQSLPRATGATRSFAITALALLCFFLISKKSKNINIIILFIIVFYSTIIWVGQSRGSLLCYYLTAFVLIFFLNNLNISKKLFLFLAITIISIFLSDLLIKGYNFYKFNYSVTETETETQSDTKLLDKKKTENRINIYKYKNNKNKYEFFNSRVLENSQGTSGRTNLWIKAYSIYDKNKIFGYGPQADRFILKDLQNRYSDNSSNLLVYGFLSGGYLSVLSMIILYIYILVLIIKFIYKNKILSKKYIINQKNISYTLSFLLLIFFSIRSIFENSYGLFSIDFLFMILSASAIEHYNKKNYI